MDIIQLYEQKQAQQRMLEQKAFTDFKIKEEEARQAYLDYFEVYCTKLDVETLDIYWKALKQQINELNQIIIDEVNGINLKYTNMLDIYQLHVQKKNKELQIVEALIKQKTNV